MGYFDGVKRRFGDFRRKFKRADRSRWLWEVDYPETYSKKVLKLSARYNQNPQNVYNLLKNRPDLLKPALKVSRARREGAGGFVDIPYIVHGFLDEGLFSVSYDKKAMNALSPLEKRRIQKTFLESKNYSRLSESLTCEEFKARGVANKNPFFSNPTKRLLGLLFETKTVKPSEVSLVKLSKNGLVEDVIEEVSFGGRVYRLGKYGKKPKYVVVDASEAVARHAGLRGINVSKREIIPIVDSQLLKKTEELMGDKQYAGIYSHSLKSGVASRGWIYKPSIRLSLPVFASGESAALDTAAHESYHAKKHSEGAWNERVLSPAERGVSEALASTTGAVMRAPKNLHLREKHIDSGVEEKVLDFLEEATKGSSPSLARKAIEDSIRQFPETSQNTTFLLSDVEAKLRQIKKTKAGVYEKEMKRIEPLLSSEGKELVNIKVAIEKYPELAIRISGLKNMMGEGGIREVLQRLDSSTHSSTHFSLSSAEIPEAISKLYFAVTPVAFDMFNRYRAQGMGKEEAMSKVQREMAPNIPSKIDFMVAVHGAQLAPHYLDDLFRNIARKGKKN